MHVRQVYEDRRHRMYHCTGDEVRNDGGAGETAANTPMKGAEGSVSITKVRGGCVKGWNEEPLCEVGTEL
jgi:hypothetical protein